MSFSTLSKRHAADAPAGWQPIGLPAPEAPAAFVRRTVSLPRPTVARLTLVPAAAVAASAAMVSMAAAAPASQVTVATDTSSTSVSAAVPITSGAAGTSTAPTAAPTTSTTASTTTGTTAPPAPGLSFLPSLFGKLPLSSLPTSNLPVAGGFVNGALLNGSMFTGGLFGGQTVQTSTDPNQMGGTMGDTAQGSSTDACDFFLQHMWKNADGIPLLGSSSHFLTYHTDPSFQNLVLSLASGAIGNSDMPIIDVYQGPLGWIPIFNPKHMRAHGADYLSLVTGCDGMGLPIDVKTMRLDLSKLPTPDKLAGLATKIMPTLPSLSKILGPDYLYNTLDINQIMDRLGPSTVFNPNEYV